MSAANATPSFQSPDTSRWEASSGGATVTVRGENVFVNGVSVSLTKQQSDFLRLLAEGEGRVRTPRMLLRGLYESEKAADQKILDVLACQVRAALRAAHPDAGKVIKTVWGRGSAFGTPERHAKPILEVMRSPSAVPERRTTVGNKDIGLSDLPDARMRWKASRKANIWWIVRTGLATLEQVLAHYPDLSHEEFEEWSEAIQTYGPKALRTTKVEKYGLKLDTAA
ncbi:MAG: DUF1153 domain-containing protein [Patescibacteria group bacterium]